MSYLLAGPLLLATYAWYVKAPKVLLLNTTAPSLRSLLTPLFLRFRRTAFLPSWTSRCVCLALQAIIALIHYGRPRTSSVGPGKRTERLSRLMVQLLACDAKATCAAHTASFTRLELTRCAAGIHRESRVCPIRAHLRPSLQLRAGLSSGEHVSMVCDRSLLKLQSPCPDHELAANHGTHGGHAFPGPARLRQGRHRCAHR